jgi:cobalt-zinc-cadmium efflux system protein
MAPVLIIAWDVLIIAIIGLGANVLSIRLIGSQHENDINIKSAYIHVLGDTLSSIAVIIGAIILLISPIYWIDPIIALIIAGLLIRGTYRVLKESLSTLMQKSPIDTNEVISWLKMQPKIVDTHDLHIWRLCSNVIILSCHVVVESNEFSEACSLREKVNADLAQKFNIQHSTIQIELESEHCTCDLRHRESTYGEGATCPID